MTPGMWTSFLIDLTPEETIRTFVRKGWTHFELSDEHGRMLLERGDPIKAGEDFKRFAADQGASIPQGHLWLSVDITRVADPGAGQGVLDELKRWLDLFVAIGIRAGVIHPGGASAKERGCGPERILEIQADSLAALCRHVAGTDFRICLENISTNTAGSLLRIIERVGDPHAGICLDTGHLNVAKGKQAAFVREAGSRLVALHVSDNDGSSDQHIMPYARGTVPWDELIRALKGLPYEGLFNFEIPGENRCPLEVRLAKLDYLQAILPVLLGD